MNQDEIKKRVTKCFKGNDIRCLYFKELNEELAYLTARALISLYKYKKVFIGRDMRFSSDPLANAFMKGVCDQGADVIDLGMTDTPMIYFASGKYKKPGAMITASHNTLDFNGIKLVKPGAKPIGKNTGINKIKALVLKNKFKDAKKKGKIMKKDLFQQYRKFVLSIINKKNLKPLKIVVDAGNGMAGKIIPIVFKSLPFKIIPLDFKISKKNPLNEANPAVFKNLRDVQIRVKKEKADFGMAFDSDMDRVFFVDEKGKIINASIIGSLIIKNYIGKKKNVNLLYSLICSKIVHETIKKYKEVPVRARVGHSLIKKQMRDKKAPFGVERSGHFYYSNNYYADSGIITSLIVSEIVSKSNLPFSKLIKEFDKYYKSEEKSIKASMCKHVLKNIEAIYKKRKPKVIDYFDGLFIGFQDFWFSVRQSQTESYLRINMEANTRKTLDKELKKLLSIAKRKNIRFCRIHPLV